MGKTRGFTAKTKTNLVRKKDSNTKSKWKRNKLAEKKETNHQNEEKNSVLMFKIAKENGSSLAAEGKSSKVR